MAGRPPIKEAPEFGKRLAAARQAKGLSQAALAEKLGTTRVNIGYYEREASNPTLDFIQRCARVLEVPLSDLTGSAEPKTKHKTGPPSQIEQRLEAIRNLPRNKQKVVLQLLDSFLSSNQPKAA
jgi:transcriptional regulator with XRE-family HTH domain